MAEPLPAASTSADAEGEETHLPTNAEDRKAAAALSTLSADTQNLTSTPALPSAADQEALAGAINRLEKTSAASSSATATKNESEKSEKEKAVEAQREKEKARRKIKVSGEDVGVLVEELDLSKGKATELLRRYEGDLGRAIRGFIGSPGAERVEV
ncbi:MAG: hypothetical protein Q9227_004157 [Pyrenula ochraceoflavens]